MNSINENLFSESIIKFQEHLNIPNNDRIIFSAKFGSGKSTFLKHYFTEKGFAELNNTHFEVFHLFPVNYSIASNEDILELIKYDITIELLKKTERISIYQDNVDTTISFAKKHYDKVIERIIEAIPKINPSITFADIPGLVKSFFNLKRVYEAHSKKENLLINQGNSLIEFLNDGDNTIGKLYESNYITQIIQSVIEKHKLDFEEKNNGKNLENILIIDDLDRIDPEHIFRILNVFGAHFDSALYLHKGLKNKFGFDKVILVCDINNIRKLFSARYGQDTDFSGYIDKFFSVNTFHFDISNSLKNFLFQEFQKRQISFEGSISYFHQRLGENNMPMYINLLIENFRYGKFNLRKVINLPTVINIQNYYSFKGNFSIAEERGIIFMLLIIKAMGGIQNTIDSFRLLKISNFNIKEILGNYTSELFRIYTRDQHKFLQIDLVTLTSGYKTYDNIQIKSISTMDLKNSKQIQYQGIVNHKLLDVEFDNNEIYDFIEDSVLFIKECNLEY